MRKQEAAAAVSRQNKPRAVPPCYTRFYALHMGNCPYFKCLPELSGKRYAPSFLQGTRPRYASGTLMMSLPEGIATPCTHLDSREAHPVLARQLLIRLHKALRSRTRGTENAHTLITHRLKQAQQLRGHAVSR